MGDVVRRKTQSLMQGVEDGDFQPPAERRGEALIVRTQKCLGVQPHLLIEWEVPSGYWDEGYRLLGFRSSTGFASEVKPKDLSAHGQLILEETGDGNRQEALPEGTYYYTFLLRKKHWLSDHLSDPVRFSETIPSAKTRISRIEDRMRLAALREEFELRPVSSEIARNEMEIKLHRSREALAKIKAPKADEDSLEAAVRREVDPLVRKALVNAHTRLEMAIQLEALRKKLKKHAGWKTLSPQQQRYDGKCRGEAC